MKITRRRFLSTGAVGTGAILAPSLIPASVLGRGGAVAPSERIVLGGIGIGGRGSYVLSHMLNEPGVQCVSVCEPLKSRREAARDLVNRKYGNNDCTTYGDLREFLSEEKRVDAVLIASGDRWHALASVLAMRAGCA